MIIPLHPHGAANIRSGKTSGQGITTIGTSQIEHPVAIDFGTLAIWTGVSNFGGGISLKFQVDARLEG